LFKKNKKKNILKKPEEKIKKSIVKPIAKIEDVIVKSVKDIKKEKISKPTVPEPVTDNCQCCEAGCTCCDHQSGTVGHRCVCRCHA
jgi:hypothetical protein